MVKNKKIVFPPIPIYSETEETTTNKLVIKQKRKSIRKIANELTAKTANTITHFTLEPDNSLKITESDITPNSEIIHFGETGTQKSTIKAYAFKNNTDIIVFRINKEYITLDKHKLREVVAFCSKGAWYLGLYGKRALKYRSKEQAIATIFNSKKGKFVVSKNETVN